MIFISLFFTQVWFDWIYLNYLSVLRVEAWAEVTFPWETFDISLSVNIVLLTENVTWDFSNREQKKCLSFHMKSSDWFLIEISGAIEFIQVSHISPLKNWFLNIFFEARSVNSRLSEKLKYLKYLWYYEIERNLPSIYTRQNPTGLK